MDYIRIPNPNPRLSRDPQFDLEVPEDYEEECAKIEDIRIERAIDRMEGRW